MCTFTSYLFIVSYNTYSTIDIDISIFVDLTDICSPPRKIYVKKNYKVWGLWRLSFSHTPHKDSQCQQKQQQKHQLPTTYRNCKALHIFFFYKKNRVYTLNKYGCGEDVYVCVCGTRLYIFGEDLVDRNVCCIVYLCQHLLFIQYPKNCCGLTSFS